MKCQICNKEQRLYFFSFIDDVGIFLACKKCIMILKLKYNIPSHIEEVVDIKKCNNHYKISLDGMSYFGVFLEPDSEELKEYVTYTLSRII